MKKQTKFSEQIISWYKKHGRKTLPWQIKKTAYKIWISEIMLQQTQVTRVIPYFQRFIYEFPDINKLAKTKLDKILYLWSGLGYYRRARNLYKTANIIVEKHHSIFPKKFDILIKLPGIGRSTAGAILSLAFKKNYPILDSNVKRILVRYYTISNCGRNNNEIEKKLWIIINNTIPNQNISKFNQGLMDLGEMICTKNNPKCSLCPINNECQAYTKNIIELYPNKKNKKVILKKNIWLLILQYKNTVWLERCSQTGIWSDLFSFPQFNIQKDLYTWLLHHNLKFSKCQILPNFQHKLSHLFLNIMPVMFNINNNNITPNKKIGLWFNLIKPQIIGLPKPISQLIKKITQTNDSIPNI